MKKQNIQVYFYSKLLIYIPTTFLVRTEKYSLKQYNKDLAREGDISPKLQCNVFHNGRLFSTDVYIDNFYVKIAIIYDKMVNMKIILVLTVSLMVAAQMCEVLNANCHERIYNNPISLGNLLKFEQYTTKTIKQRKKKDTVLQSHCTPIIL